MVEEKVNEQLVADQKMIEWLLLKQESNYRLSHEKLVYPSPL